MDKIKKKAYVGSSDYVNVHSISPKLPMRGLSRPFPNGAFIRSNIEFQIKEAQCLWQFFKRSQMKAEQTTFNQIILPPGFVYGPILDQMANGFKANLGFYSKRLVLCPIPPHSLILKKMKLLIFCLFLTLLGILK